MMFASLSKLVSLLVLWFRGRSATLTLPHLWGEGRRGGEPWMPQPRNAPTEDDSYSTLKIDGQ
jgi:hypothetical protein